MGSVIYTFVLIQSYFVGVNHQRRKLNSRMGKGEGSGEGWGEGQGKGGEWKGSLCGSCDCGSKCFIGCCCPPCGNYFVAQKMNEEGWPAWIGFLDFCGGDVVKRSADADADASPESYYYGYYGHPYRWGGYYGHGYYGHRYGYGYGYWG